MNRICSYCFRNDKVVIMTPTTLPAMLVGILFSVINLQCAGYYDDEARYYDDEAGLYHCNATKKSSQF